MFMFIFVMIIVFIFLIIQKDNRTSSKYLAATLLAYVFTIFSMILYLSKDTYYYNIVNNYFSLPKVVWKYFMFINIPRDMIIRMLNFSSLSVIFLGYCFSLSYRERAALHILKYLRLILPLILIFQMIVYDPFVQYKAYFICYPRLLSLAQIVTFKQTFHTITATINNGIIVISILQLFHTYKKVYFLHFLRNYLIGEGICYTLVMTSYVMIFWFSPTYLVKISKIADNISYLSVPLNRNQLIYTVFPYFLLITELLCVFCIYEIASIKRKMKNKDFSITKQIDAADTTSKIFCHYMKNELLAIQSEVEMLEVTTDNEEGIQNVLCRCKNIYQRLDTIHRSTKTSKLDLVETDIMLLITDMIGRMKSNFKNCQITAQLATNIPNVMIDSVYFEQAVNNIIDNALDSMETIPLSQRKITIGLQEIDDWIILSIQDSGIGISENNIKNIFTPLFSSKPITKHWGIGLALTHRIIMAHEGKIEVESHANIGTTFKIFLPDIDKFIS